MRDGITGKVDVSCSRFFFGAVCNDFCLVPPSLRHPNLFFVCQPKTYYWNNYLWLQEPCSTTGLLITKNFRCFDVIVGVKRSFCGERQLQATPTNEKKEQRKLMLCEKV